MPIEINGPSSPQARQPGDTGSLRVVSDAPASPRLTNDPAASKDSINLSGAASLIQRLDSRISALPVVDTARVNTIRQSIADGSFHPDFLRVADSLIDREVALHGRHHDDSAD